MEKISHQHLMVIAKVEADAEQKVHHLLRIKELAKIKRTEKFLDVRTNFLASLSWHDPQMYNKKTKELKKATQRRVVMNLAHRLIQQSEIYIIDVMGALVIFSLNLFW